MSKKDAFYFSHDCNARHDPKIIKLRTRHGLEGYGFYFCLLEIMRESADYSIEIEDLETVSYQLNLSHEKAEEIIKTCVKVKLLKQDQNKLLSKSFIDRMQEVDEMRKKQSENGKKGGRPKANENPNETQMKANENPNESQKGKERKEDKIKEKEGKEINREFDELLNSQPDNETPPNQERDFILWDYFQSEATKLLHNNESLHAIKAPEKFEHYMEVINNKNLTNPKAAIKGWIKKDLSQFIEVNNE